MAIQWFPGHMNATKKAIATRIKQIDVVIEMLDARLPGSSASPMLAELTAGKPSVKVLNKQDVADPTRTQQWLAYYNSLPGVRAIGLDASTIAPTKALMAACSELAPNRGGLDKPMRVLICGVPNVGKSTLINTMAGKRATKTGDEAGITKIEQRITLANDFFLYDTPGMLWPRIIVPESGYNLAASGAIGRNAYEDDDVALELLSYLKRRYPQALAARYKIDNAAACEDIDLLESIGRMRGALIGGKRIDLQKSAEIVIHDFRSAVLGRISLETPDEYAKWRAAGEIIDAERQVKKDAFAAAKKKKVKKPREALPSSSEEIDSSKSAGSKVLKPKK
jgi:ribosome biogenesis GTPase A